VIFRLAQELNKRYNITMFKNSFNRFFFRFFPAPNFFAGSSFGLDISDESLKFVELVLSGGGLSLGRYGERSIPPGVIESGKIKDSKKMEEILTALRKEAGVKSVRVSCRKSKYICSSFDWRKWD